jgi:hypothetical protein
LSFLAKTRIGQVFSEALWQVASAKQARRHQDSKDNGEKACHCRLSVLSTKTKTQADRQRNPVRNAKHLRTSIMRRLAKERLVLL